MLTKNIRFNNFKGKKINRYKKKIKNEFKSGNILNKYPMLNSLKKNYNYSYKKKNLQSLKKYNSYNLIGMGG